MNGLLYAKLRGNAIGEFDGALSFQELGAYENPDNSLRGHQNAQYDVIPRLIDLDPTSQMALALQSAHQYTPKGSTGYTSEFRALDYLSAMSSQLAHWFREFQTLYYAALKAESELHNNAGTRVDVDMDVRYGQGIVEAFYAAVGDFTDRAIGYQESVPLSVQKVYERTLQAMEPWLDILDHEGWLLGENSAKEYIGIGAIPQTKQNVICLSANAKDSLFAFPWTRILTVPRARGLIEEVFMERVNAALAAEPALNPLYITITEGDSVLMIPGVIAAQGFDAICEAIDARPDIHTRYNSIGGQSWLDQFYTTGDLTAALLQGDLHPYDVGHLCVMLSEPVLEAVDGVAWWMGAANDGAICSTGALSSVNRVVRDVNRPNYITGSHTAIVDGSGLHWSQTDGATPIHSINLGVSDWLPNGVLYCGSVGEATAVDWLNILRTLSRSLPVSSRVILDKSGRAKRSLPSGVPTISVDALMARAVSYGQRDGYIATVTKAFNSKRLNRNEQEGPALKNSWVLTTGAAVIIAGNRFRGHVSPAPAAFLNGWSGVDGNAGKFILTPEGNTIYLNGPIPSSFVGEFDAGRYAAWVPGFLPDTQVTADNTVERYVARSLMSYPLALETGVYLPRYIPDSDVIVNHTWATTFSTSSAKGTQATAFFNLVNGCTVNGDVIPGYEGSLALESFHPTSGFVRGLATFTPTEARSTFNSSVPLYAPGGSACGRSRASIGGALSATGQLSRNSATQFVLTTYVGNDSALGVNPDAGTPCQLWMWDPTRSQIVGDAWTRWGGVFFDDVLPDPYCPHPVAQMTASMGLADLLAYQEISMRSTGVLTYSNQLTTPAAAPAGTHDEHIGRLFAINDQTAALQYDNALVPDLEGPIGYIPVNSGSRWRAAISAPGIADQNAAYNGLYTGTNSDMEPTAIIERWAAIMPVSNACSNHGKAPLRTVSIASMHQGPTASDQLDGYFSWMGLPTTDIATRAGVAFGNILCPMFSQTEDVDHTFLNVMEGAVLAPVAAANHAGQGGLIVEGQGIVFEGDVLTPGMLDPMMWLAGVYDPAETTIRNLLGNVWPTMGAEGALNFVARDVGGGLPWAQQNPLSALANSIDPSVLHRLSNDWFQRGNGLNNKHARMRRSELVNPWTRAAGTSGIVDATYMSDGVLPMLNGFVDAFRTVGRKFQAGLESSMFLEVHQAN
jgi:hypothetical protein